VGLAVADQPLADPGLRFSHTGLLRFTLHHSTIAFTPFRLPAPRVPPLLSLRSSYPLRVFHRSTALTLSSPSTHQPRGKAGAEIRSLQLRPGIEKRDLALG